MGSVIKCFVIPPNSKIEQTKRLAAMTAKNIFFMLTGTQICRSFKVHDLITCESKVQVVVSRVSEFCSPYIVIRGGFYLILVNQL